MPFTVPTITKPFADYKWRWMEFTPVESFNRIDILLGVARAIQDVEGELASSNAFNARLQKVQTDLLPTGSPSLTSTNTDRNLIRRQGRYWRGLDILAPVGAGEGHGMTLTPMGRSFANGSVSPDDFVRHAIATHRLPNPSIDTAKRVQEWHGAGLSMRPLSIIVSVLTALAAQAGPNAAYLTNEQLHRVLVPLSIVNKDPDFLAEAVLAFRQDKSPFALLPNCAPGANDRRMLREHLLFLHYGDVLTLEDVGENYRDRFRLRETDAAIAVEAIQGLHEASLDERENAVADAIVTVQRNRRSVEVLDRPSQAKFRRDVLGACDSKCLITGETLQDVLIACHIHEVKDGGSDHVSNGITLRADLHILFDSQKLRIGDEGQVTLAPDIAEFPSYSALPANIELPEHLNKAALRIRYEYGIVS
ncbi:HNH endonuclease signature motif containing protein [Qipengyuania marisflavi]|uniref:HNH endonuclease signature motif containing protein n=1 Tax=Qipengyuania marisflavi TaxID=2486356 RepID=UPI0014866834|nr:HNH endonuclease signature motif containing protein [Qipengyuania marisflavi]